MNIGTLYLCPTPLGNLEDITLRVLRVLREVDKIAAEDTRHTRKLLSHYQIHTPMVSYHEHNKQKKTPVLIEWLLSGQNIALVSDAGTPGIADPGEELVQAAVSHHIRVEALPGPVAAIVALTASALPVMPFVFYGFLPQRGAPKKETLARILSEDKTAIFYEAPHRLRSTLKEITSVDAGRQLVIARELTKVHEEFIRGSAEEIWRHFAEAEPRGEVTVLLAGTRNKLQQNCIDPNEVAAQLLAGGMSVREAAREAARLTGAPRNELYRQLLKKE